MACRDSRHLAAVQILQKRIDKRQEKGAKKLSDEEMLAVHKKSAGPNFEALAVPIAA